MDKKEIFKRMAVQIVYVAMQVLFSRINLHGISPIGISFAMIQIYSGRNIFLVTLTYAFSKLYLFANWNLVFATVYEIVIITLYYFTKAYTPLWF